MAGRVDTGQPVSRFELLFVLVATLVGGWLRGLRLGALGLSHFDEGIYAISGLWPFTGSFEANQGFYSPPLFPGLVGLAYLALGGPLDTGAIGVNWLFGTLAIPMAWWFARTWWTPITGMATAALVAQDAVLIAFSRVALTDSVYLCAFLLALHLATVALLKGGLGRALRAGVAVGFTWNIKYNGFMALLACLGGLAGYRGSKIPKKSQVTQLLQMTCIAVTCYLPWAAWFHMKHEGGYGALVAHQRGYWVGPVAGFSNLQLYGKTANAVAERLQTPVGPPCEIGPHWLWPGAIALAIAVGFSGCLSIAPPAWFPFAVASLGAITSCYSFYLRLWLPLHLFLVVTLATLLGELIQAAVDCHADGPKRLFQSRTLTAAVLLACLVPMMHFATNRPGIETTTGYRETAKAIARFIDEKDLRQFDIVGMVRPPLVFYLAQLGVPIRRLPDDEEVVRAIPHRALLLVDPAARDSKRFMTAFDRERSGSAPSFQLLGHFLIDQSFIATLESARPDLAGDTRQQFEVLIYQRTGAAK